MRQSRVVLVGDANLLSTGIASLLRAESEIDVIFLDGEDLEVLAKVRGARADIIVVLSIDGAASLTWVARILHENPETPVVAVGLDRPDMHTYWSGRVRQASPGELLSAIREVQQVHQSANS